MSATKFTPGPWIKHPCMAWVCPEDAPELPICQMRQSTDGDDAENKHADAALIAAAPELYEALTNCLKRLRTASAFAGNADWAIDGLCAQYEAVLAKARGEA